MPFRGYADAANQHPLEQMVGEPGGIPYTPNSKPQLGYGLGCFIMFHRWVYHIKETCGLSKNKCGYWIKQHDESPILATFGLWGPQSLVS